MNRASTHALTGLCLSALAVLIAGTALHAGPLTPPIGPVASTNKTLQDIEPRTAINATNTPGDTDSLFRITQPGSYYLTGNISGASNKHGIEIAASSVTIDLNGFRIHGVIGSLSGITTGSARENIIIRNGTVSSWGAEGINLSLAGPGVTIEGVNAVSNGATGIRGSSGVIMRSCTARNNGLIGLYASSSATIVDCTALSNGSFGIEAVSDSSISNCSANGNSGFGFSIDHGGSITNCIARDNLGSGIGGYQGVSITSCAAFANTEDGIHASFGCTVSGCSASDNVGEGISASIGCTIAGCTARSNTSNGIICSSACSIIDCTLWFNALDGIRALSGCTIRGNTCNTNGNGATIGAGIHITGSDNRIEGNNCTSNDFGIDVDAAGNMIVSNSCAGNTQNFVIAVDNIYGPIVNRTAPASPAMVGNSAAGTMGSTDPNTNYAF